MNFRACPRLNSSRIWVRSPIRRIREASSHSVLELARTGIVNCGSFSARACLASRPDSPRIALPTPASPPAPARRVAFLAGFFRSFFIFLATTAGLGTAPPLDRAAVFFRVVLRTVFFFATAQRLLRDDALPNKVSSSDTCGAEAVSKIRTLGSVLPRADGSITFPSSSSSMSAASV